MEKIIFKKGYFEDIKKVQYFRKPLDSVGLFKEVIIVHYNKWYKFSEKIELDSKEEAKKLVDFLANKLNQEVTLRDIILKD